MKNDIAHIIDIDEKIRVRLHARGWNDAQRDRPRASGQSIAYYVGYADARPNSNAAQEKHHARR